MPREAKILGGIFGVIIVGMIAVFAFMGGGDSSSNNTNSADQSKLVRDDSHKIGSGSVTMVEFGDFQCPACASAEPILEKLRGEYKDKLTFAFRNYPLPMHKNAISAAEAAEAAGAQGKYWEMHDKLYASQTEWENLPDPVDKFAEYARGLGLDAEKLAKEIRDNTHVDFINKDKADGDSVGVSATPTIYINGKQATSFDYATLKGMIDEALKQ